MPINFFENPLLFHLEVISYLKSIIKPKKLNAEKDKFLQFFLKKFFCSEKFFRRRENFLLQKNLNYFLNYIFFQFCHNKQLKKFLLLIKNFYKKIPLLQKVFVIFNKFLNGLKIYILDKVELKLKFFIL